MKNECMNICLSADDNYAQHLGVTLKSLILQHNDSDLHIYILDSGISAENKQKILTLANEKTEIVFAPINETVFNNYELDKNSYITAAMFNRFVIPELLADKERVLYLDVDLVVLKNLRQFYFADMSGKAIGMIKDYNYKECEKRLGVENYYNSGVMLFDIKKCREVGLTARLMQALAENKQKLFCPDQDIINMQCQDLIKEFDFIYNAQAHPLQSANIKLINDEINQIAILHYTTALKPWGVQKHPLEKYYWQVLVNTPWQDAITKIKKERFYRMLWAWLYSYSRQDDIKSWRLMGVPVFAKKKIGDIRKFYVFGVMLLKIRKRKK